MSDMAQAFWGVGIFTVLVLGGLVYYEYAYPCLRYQTTIVTAYQRVGDTFIPVPYAQKVCVERGTR